MDAFLFRKRNLRLALSVLLKQVSKFPWIKQMDWKRIGKGQTSLCQSMFFHVSSVKTVSNPLHSTLLPITCPPASCSWLWMRWQKSGLHSRVRGFFSWMGTGSVVSSRCCHSSSLSGSWGIGEGQRTGGVVRLRVVAPNLRDHKELQEASNSFSTDVFLPATRFKRYSWLFVTGL